MNDAEIEDLVPPQILAHQLDRWQRTAESSFADEIEAGKPIIPQIEAWAKKNSIELPKPGWKVELAKRVKQQLLADGPNAVATDVLAHWAKLFHAFQNTKVTAHKVDRADALVETTLSAQ
jgi:hypothetical protein